MKKFLVLLLLTFIILGQKANAALKVTPTLI